VLALQASAAAAQRLTLNVAQSSIVLPSADPDTTPSIAAPPLIVVVRVQQNNSQPWQLTVQANGDLVAGGSTIDISNVTWTASPAPFQDGTLSKAAAQTLASGTGNLNPAVNGSVVFRLANSWNYAAGIYSQTLVFTLSAP
jgi:hypothetical protein